MKSKKVFVYAADGSMFERMSAYGRQVGGKSLPYGKLWEKPMFFQLNERFD